MRRDYRENETVESQRGITFSGGDPLLQPAGLLPIAKAAKEMGFDVWAYTGFVWEMLMDTKHVNYQEIQALLPYIDVLVDGRFIERKKRAGLRFRGSSNQRIIDVPSSLKKGQVVLAEEYMH